MARKLFLSASTLLDGFIAPESLEDLMGSSASSRSRTSFSIVALIWRPGQRFKNNRIHDHLTWRAVAVIRGVEHEERFDADFNRSPPMRTRSATSAVSRRLATSTTCATLPT